eukprot:TRINITY_DN26304_c0_g1_i1.p1 TRINITY_DN26304_c0_g1~~TRINITY_DN26304_c0_g1_i1.p1  ORF type:complete len:2616 (+),score=645.94 TRINITY_DN26304_c0_g1_i1:60-7850(+)
MRPARLLLLLCAAQSARAQTSGLSPGTPATLPTDVDCQMSGWTAWDPCSVTCGTGTTTRTRTTLIAQSGSGLPCDDNYCTNTSHAWYVPGGYVSCSATRQTVVCSGTSCAAAATVTVTNCTMTGWSAWSPCNATCGAAGHRARTRSVIVQGVWLWSNGTINGTVPCPDTSEVEVCNSTVACAANASVANVSCVVSGWGSWSTCDAACPFNATNNTVVNGTEERERFELIPAQGGGTPCPHLNETASCNETCVLPPVPDRQPCLVTGWTPWGVCNATCGAGNQTRERSVIFNPNANETSADCTEPLSEMQGCDDSCNATNTSSPVAACVVTGWSPWSPDPCPVCGNDTQVRTRSVFSNLHGEPCPDLEENRSCNTPACTESPTAAVTSVCPGYTGWGPWGPCNVSCGSGWRRRQRTVNGVPSDPGYSLCNETLEEEEFGCNPASCASVNRDCVMGNWSDTHTGGNYTGLPGGWTPCSVRCCEVPGCGGGYQRRYRSVVASQLGNGSACGPTEETRWNCNNQTCQPVACQVGSWSAWDTCSLTCVPPSPPGVQGYQWRYRNVTQEPLYAGAACPVLSERRDCNPAPPQCSEDCTFAEWSGADHSATDVLVPPNSAVPNSGWRECSLPCQDTINGVGWTVRFQKFLPTEFWREPGVRIWGTGTCDFCTGANQQVVKNNGTLWIHHSLGSSWGGPVNPGSIASTPSWAPLALGSSAHFIVDTGFICMQNESCNTQTCIDLNCTVSDWTSWGDCSKPCQYRFPCSFDGTSGALCSSGHVAGSDPKVAWSLEPPGQRCRTRFVLTDAQGEGTQCPATSECENCNEKECDIDCVLSTWSEWGACTAACWDQGVGAQPTRSRTRYPIVQKSNDGRVCGALVETEVCDLPACNQACRVGDWGAWTHCSLSCGGGTQTRSRQVIQRPITGGVDQSVATACDSSHCGAGALPGCSSTADVRSCNQFDCRQGDCVVTAWGPWGACRDAGGAVATCAPAGSPAGGARVRERSVVSMSDATGLPCPVLRESLPCAQNPCPTDCVAGNWTAWSACSAVCGGGVTDRSRVGDVQPVGGGAPCPLPRTESQTCNEAACRQEDCRVGEWGTWSDCTALCGGGTQSRNRIVVLQPLPGGAACPALSEWRVCNAQLCPVSCEVGGWGEWSECSVECGGGSQESLRHILRFSAAGGAQCPLLLRQRDCSPNSCRAGDCLQSAWTDWAACSKTCGGGTQSRSRTVVTEPTPPAICGPSTEIRECSLHQCPVDCVVGGWWGWELCSKSCGGGYQLKRRPVLQPNEGNGIPCPQIIDVQGCNQQTCSAADCQVGEFGEWGACSAECGTGIATRTRNITDTRTTIPGAPCPPLLTDRRLCNVQPCPTPCVLSSWSSWSECSRPCGGGVRIRERWVVQAAAGGGAACEALEQHSDCSASVCDPNDCQVTGWSDWTACTAACGGGTKSRTRSVVNPGAAGASCPVLVENMQCGAGPCDESCIVSEWGGWDICTATCGGGTQERLRWVVRGRKGAGAPCPSLREVRTCAEAACRSADCVAAGWGEWGNCSAACGGGAQTRTRTLPAAAACSGFPTTDTRSCNMQSCSLVTTPAPPGTGAAVSVPLLQPIGVVPQCGTVTVNGNRSAVAGGDRARWTSQTAAPALQSLLASAEGRLWFTVDVAAVLGASAASHTICLFLGTAVDCETIRVVSTEYDFSVRFEGGPSTGCGGGAHACITSDQGLYMHAATDWTRCSGGSVAAVSPPPDVEMKFAWGGLSGLRRQAVSATNSLTYPSVMLPGGSLPAGTHPLEVSACASGSPLPAEMCRNLTATVVVGAAPIRAVIAGGNRTVVAGSGLVLDGGQSVDPDKSATDPITYAWDCTELSPDAVCGGTFPTRPSTSPTLSVDPVPPAGAYLFSLAVARGGRSAAAPPATVRVLSSGVGVTVSCTCQDPGSVPHDRQLAVWANAATTQPVTYRWTVTRDGGDAGLNVGISTTNRYLVLPAAELQAGSVYVAKVEVGRSSDRVVVGNGEITFVTATPPAGGSCAARSSTSSSVVTSVGTTVDITCAGWTCGGSGEVPEYRFSEQRASGARNPLGLGYRTEPALRGVTLRAEADETVRVLAQIRCPSTGATEFSTDSTAVFVSQSSGDPAAAAQRLRAAVAQGRMPEAAQLLRLTEFEPLKSAVTATNATQMFLSMRQEGNRPEEIADLLDTARGLATNAGSLTDTLVAGLAAKVAELTSAAAQAASDVDASATLDALQVVVACLSAAKAAATAAAGGAASSTLSQLYSAARDTVAGSQAILAASTHPGLGTATQTAGSIEIAVAKVEPPGDVQASVLVSAAGVSLPTGVAATAGYDLRVAVWDTHPFTFTPDARVVGRHVSVDVRDLATGAPLTDFGQKPLRLHCPTAAGSRTLPQGAAPLPGVSPVWFNLARSRWDVSGLTLSEVATDAALARQVVLFLSTHATDFTVLWVGEGSVTPAPPPISSSGGSGGTLMWILIVLGVVLCGCCIAVACLCVRRRTRKAQKEKALKEAEDRDERRGSELQQRSSSQSFRGLLGSSPRATDTADPIFAAADEAAAPPPQPNQNPLIDAFPDRPPPEDARRRRRASLVVDVDARSDSVV